MKDADRSAQAGKDTVSHASAYCVKHQIIHIKDPVRGRIDTVEGAQLCQFEKKGQKERHYQCLFQSTMKIVPQIDAERQKQSQITSYLKPGRMRDVDSSDPCSDPIYLFPEIMEKGKGMELNCNGKRICQNRFERRQRGDNIQIHTNQIENKGIHNEGTGHNEAAVFPLLIDSIGNEKEYGDQGKQGVDHMERQ